MNRPASFDYLRVEKIDRLEIPVIPRAVGHSYELRAHPRRAICTKNDSVTHKRSQAFFALSLAVEPPVEGFAAAVDGQRQRSAFGEMKKDCRLVIDRPLVLLDDQQPARSGVFQRMCQIPCRPGSARSAKSSAKER